MTVPDPVDDAVVAFARAQHEQTSARLTRARAELADARRQVVRLMEREVTLEVELAGWAERCGEDV